MSRPRSEPDHTLYRQRQRYYKRNREAILAKARIRYQARKLLEVRLTQKRLQDAQIQELLESPELLEGSKPQLPWLQRLKSKLFG